MFKKVPQYRLQGYTDAWELRKLGEFVDKAVDNRGKTPPLDEEGTHPLIEVAALGGVHPDYTKIDKYLNDESFENNLRSYVKKDDILFTTVGSIGLVSLMDSREEAAIAQNIVAFRAKDNFIPSYLYSLFTNKENQKKAIRIVMGAVQPSIKVSQLVGVEYMLTQNRVEQEAIGTFFSTLDRHITLHQRKLDMLKEQKKTYLKLLFPAKGQTKPVLRFQGFEDDWEKVKLGEIGETFTGLSGKTKEDFGHGEGKFITYVNVFNNPISDLLGTDRIEVDESQTNVQFGDIFFTTSSETPEEVGMSSVWLGNGNNIYLNSFCFGFRPTLKLSNHFMAYVLRSTEIRKKFIFLAQGISRYNISKTKVMNISIPLPTLPEQESIGTFFQTLDQEIAQVEDKLASLKEMKKTLLRKLFV